MKATATTVITVETIPVRVFRGAENAEGFDTMHTWNRVTTHVQQDGMGHGHHHHGQHHTYGHTSHTTTHHHEASENYLTLYRVYLDGSYPEPVGFPQLSSVENYMRQNANSCTIL